jgi:hypothetical protein
MDKINQLELGTPRMKTNVTLIASAVFLTLTLGIAHAADTNAPSGNTGAAVGTPGSENKGNPIPVPDQATGGTVDKGSNASTTTPAEENKGKPTTPQ